jgi:excisionase family DNA binding protein
MSDTERADRLIRTIEAADRLNVGRDEIYRLVKVGRLRSIKLGSRVLRFAESDLARLIRERRI